MSNTGFLPMNVVTRPAFDFAAARRSMIDSQLRTSGVNDPWVLERMLAVPREDFVPEALRAGAYVDRAISLGQGGVIAAPVFYGMLLSEARPRPSDTALVVDAGSGYLPALLSGLVGSMTVVSAEAGAKGAAKGEFTLLLIDGAVEHIPPALAKRLTDDGRAITGIVEGAVTQLAIGRKAAGSIGLLPVSEMGIPRLPAFDRPKAWSF